MEVLRCDKYLFRWTSKVCGCHAEFRDGKKQFHSCNQDHLLWCVAVGENELDVKLQMVRNAQVTNNFQFALARYGSEGSTFHRPKLVDFDLNAPNAEVGFFLLESMGVELTACSNSQRYADYLANKATRGLTEKMWLDDWNNGCLFPAELVADPSLHLPREEANRLFGINLDSQYIAQFKSLRRHIEKRRSL